MRGARDHAPQPLLVLDDVSLCLWRGDSGVQVLDGVSLDLHAGELGGVHADRNAGKTTLARVAVGAILPDSGTVRFAGSVLDERARTARGGALHSDVALATRTGPRIADISVRDWIATTLLMTCGWREARGRASRALMDVGASDAARHPWSQVSDSERALASIAHGLARRPRLLVVDDPIAGLGAVRRAEVMQLLRQITDTGTAVLITAAELSDFKGIDRIWSLSGGRLNGAPPRPQANVVELRRTGGSTRSGA
jgi:ABC-type multidrug transport system ATPase subunit